MLDAWPYQVENSLRENTERQYEDADDEEHRPFVPAQVAELREFRCAEHAQLVSTQGLNRPEHQGRTGNQADDPMVSVKLF